MQRKIDLKKVVQLEVQQIKVHDYVVNIGEVLRKEDTTEFISFTINGNVLSAAFYWYRKGTTLLVLQADCNKPIGLS